MEKVNSLHVPSHLIWLNTNDYYKLDKWLIKDHKHFNQLTKKQQEYISEKTVLDFSICKNTYIKNEVKNACAYLLEYKLTKLHTLFHDKYIVNNILAYFNNKFKDSMSILELNVNELELDYEQFLNDKGIITRSKSVSISKNMELIEYIEKNKLLTFIRRIYEINKAANESHLKEKEKDIWDIRQLDIRVNGFNYARPRYTINFKNILQPKIKEVVKQYEYERLKTNKYSTIIDDLKTINLLSKFLYDKYPKIDSLNKLTREVVLEFLAYIEQLPLTHTTKGQRKGSLRIFLNLIVMYNWKDAPKERLINKSDYKKYIMCLPKPIDKDILTKLNKKLKYLPIEIQRMIYTIQHIGMRVNELCQLKVGSVKKDNEGDYFLEYFQSKTERYSRIPILNDVANILLTQEKEILDKYKNAKYIFSRDGEKPIGQESFSYHINKLAFEKNIRDENNNLYRFKSHHFRHTVASKYVNIGMEPNMIRIMLGHSQMKSIMSYIKLRDNTVLKEMNEILKEQNNLIATLNNDLPMDDKIEIDLIHGKCTKPTGDICSCITRCYSCGMFNINSCDISNMRKYLEQIDKNIEHAKINGFQRLEEINNEIKVSIEKIINKKEI